MSDSQTFWVYVLLSQRTGLHYIGSTGDLDDRLIRHNAGRSKTTKADLPRTLVYGEKFDSRAAAYRRELEIKSWKSRRLIDQLVGIEHSDLSEVVPTSRDRARQLPIFSQRWVPLGGTQWHAWLAGASGSLAKRSPQSGHLPTVFSKIRINPCA